MTAPANRGIAVLWHTADYRGDHAADVTRVIDLKPGETVEALVERVKLGSNQYAVGEYLAIRVVEVLP